MRKYFGYCRCAVKKQNQKESNLDKQEKVIQEYAKCYDLDIVKIFKDFGSGIDSTRPEFTDMITRLACGERNGIICTSIDRLTRDYRALVQLMKLIDEKDIEIVTPERTYRRTTEDKLALTVMTAFAEFYAKKSAERIQRAKLQKAKQDRKTP